MKASSFVSEESSLSPRDDLTETGRLMNEITVKLNETELNELRRQTLLIETMQSLSPDIIDKIRAMLDDSVGARGLVSETARDEHGHPVFGIGAFAAGDEQGDYGDLQRSDFVSREKNLTRRTRVRSPHGET